MQCKWATRCGDVVAINCRTAHRGPEGFIRSVHSRDDVDLVAGYCAELERCYVLFPQTSSMDAHRSVSAPTRNNQLRGIRWARDFEFGRLDWIALGAVAQLGERMPGRHEATGSSPVGSTSYEPLDAGSRIAPIKSL